MSLGGAVASILKGDNTVSGIVGTKVFPNFAPQTKAFPFIVYFVVSSDPEDTKDLVDDINRVRLQISCFSMDYDQVEDLEAAVISVLNRFNGTVDSTAIDSMTLDNQEDVPDFETEAHHKAIDFIVRIK